ncbi:unnamed protein product, partial [Didymodactylos carnosus]
MRRRQPKGQ